jgi:hypothetical protein
MFGLVSKKKLLSTMQLIKDSNRKEDLYANYDNPISEEQASKNVYSQGYEDGTDNFYNCIVHNFEL